MTAGGCFGVLRRHQRLLAALDVLVIVLILHPCMVLYWRGIWDLWGFYVNPKPFPVAQWKIFGISCLTIIGYFIGPKLQQALVNKADNCRSVITRLFLFIYGAFFMAYWRGIFETTHYYVDEDPARALVVLLVTFGLLVIFRSCRSCLIPPMLVNLDTRAGALLPSTRFKTKVSTALCTYCMVLECFISQQPVLCAYSYIIQGHSQHQGPLAIYVLRIHSAFVSAVFGELFSGLSLQPFRR